jgi:hypothetical protein
MNDFSKHVLLAHQIAWHEDIAMNCSTGNLIFMGRVMMLFPPLSKKLLCFDNINAFHQDTHLKLTF